MMLDEHRTPRRFWAEAVNTACYVLKDRNGEPERGGVNGSR
jgi:hypothetical protein